MAKIPVIPYSFHRSPRRLCEAIEPLIDLQEGERIVRRPFNHYTPALTNWWIVPSLELPFFQYSKFFFSWDAEKRDTLSCGLYLAKGLDPVLKNVYPTKKGRRLLMTPEWGWHRFYPAVESREFREIVRGTAGAMGRPIQLVFEGGYVDDPGLFNPDSELRKRDRYTLVYNPADDSIKVGSAKREAMTLKFLNKVRDWKTFHEQMKFLNEEQFMWCDLFVCATYSVMPGQADFPDGSTVRSAEEIYSGFLSQFRRFLHHR